MTGFERMLHALYGMAIRAFPPDFRRRYEEDLFTSFDVYRRMAGSPASRTWRTIRAIVEAVAQGLGERFAQRRPGHHRRQLPSRRLPTLPSRSLGVEERLGWLVKDVRFAVRSFRRTPGFTLAALVILALGIGASTSVFSVVNALVFRGPPFPESEQLVRIVGTFQPEGEALEQRSASYPDYVDWRDRTTAFESMVIRDFDNVTLTAPDGEPTLIAASFITPAMFRMLRVSPARGRLLADDDDAIGNLVTVLSHAFWTTRFGADPDIVGRTITFNDRAVTVVGVAERGFGGLFGGLDAWLPFRAEGAFVPSRPSSALERRGFRGFDVFARLRPGVTLADAQQQLDRVSDGLHDNGSLGLDRGALALSFEDDNLGAARATAWILAVAVGLVMLIACANLANLLLARQLGRSREIGLRQAIGATRSDLIRQLLVESLTLGVSGGVLGALVASWMTEALAPDTLANLPSYIAPSIDVTALLFAVGIAVATGVVFGLAPALNTSRLPIVDSLKSGSRSVVGAGRSGMSLRRSLVIVQVAVAVPLLIGSALMIRSVSNTLAVDPGFDPAGVTAAEVTLPSARYDNDERAAFARRLRVALEAYPAVEHAAIASDLPMNRGYSAMTVTPDGPRYAGQEYRVYVHRVSPGYFETLRIRRLDGRGFTDQDDASAPEVVIVSRQMAERFWPGSSPVGHTIEGARIVGVVENARYRGLIPDPENTPLDPDIFLPLEQAMTARMQIAVQGRAPSAELIRLLREEIRRLDPALPVYGVTTMSDVIEGQVVASRAATRQLGAFAVLALILAAAGLFGVMAYNVSRRTNEIGVRIALGADRHSVIRMFLRQSLTLAAVGLVTGLALAAGGGRVLESQLYDVTPTDGVTYLFVTFAFLLVGLVASAVPAWRASRVDPLQSLRAE